MGLFTRDFEDLHPMAYYSDFVNRGKPHVLVDVRTPGEFAGGHLPGAVNIPLNVLQQRADELPKDQPVVVVCASGNRSQSGARQLKRVGFENIYNLQGGTLGWMRQGLQTEK